MKTQIKKAEEKMQKTLHVLSSDFAAVRAGRANPAVLDKITVDYYGTATPIQQLAAISVPEARVLMIQPWDKSSLKAIEKAILTSDIGINPNNDGAAIRLTFPPLTAERRNDLAKEIAKMGEESKVALRSIRRDVIDKIKAMKKAGTLTEDDVKDGEKEVQKLTDKYVKDVDTMVDKKKKEIQEI